MVWDWRRRFRREFATSTSSGLIFKIKFQEVKNLSWSKIIELTITRTNVKQKNCGSSIETIAFVTNQIRGKIKKMIRDDIIRILFRNIIHHILPYPQTLF